MNGCCVGSRMRAPFLIILLVGCAIVAGDEWDSLWDDDSSNNSVTEMPVPVVVAYDNDTTVREELQLIMSPLASVPSAPLETPAQQQRLS
jgi:hypothetical protein